MIDEFDPRFMPSENAADLINKLIIRKDDQRLGKNGICEIKNHPWFASIDFKKSGGLRFSYHLN